MRFYIALFLFNQEKDEEASALKRQAQQITATQHSLTPEIIEPTTPDARDEATPLPDTAELLEQTDDAKV